MPDFMFQELPPGEAKKLPRGISLVISVGSIALAAGIVIELWLGDSLGRHKGWTAALLVLIPSEIAHHSDFKSPVIPK